MIVLLACLAGARADGLEVPEVHAVEAAPSLPEQQEFRRYSIGSSLFVLFNLIPMHDPPAFFQLNAQVRLTPKDTLALEAITWTVHGPLGIPYGPYYGSPEGFYPGTIRAYGVGPAYQRYLWKGLYGAVHATPMLQVYRDEDTQVIQRGFQLFCTLRVGYRLEMFNRRVFVEPSIASTYWPIHTNMPDSFAAVDKKWPNYFLLEPGAHFGVSF